MKGLSLMKKLFALLLAFVLASGILSTTASAADINEEAQKIYQDFLDSISFIETDSTWANFLTIATFNESSYDWIFPDSAQKTPYADLTAFDKIVYAVTYVEFAAMRKDISFWNENVINSRNNFDKMCTNRYVSGVNARGGNNKETVLTAMQTLWDWQYQYCLDNNEPYNFIYNCSYSNTGFIGVSPTENPTEDPTEISTAPTQEPAGDIPDEGKSETPDSIQGETQKPVPESEPGTGDGVTDNSHSLLTIGILAVAVVVVGIIVVFVLKRKRT